MAVYHASNHWERDQESPVPRQDRPLYQPTSADLLIRYIKELVWQTMQRRSSYAAVALGCYLYVYQPGKIGCLIPWAADNLRRIKGWVFDRIQDRFPRIVKNDTVRTSPPSPQERTLVNEALRAFTPWEAYAPHFPTQPAASIWASYFAESPPRESAERRQIHALIDPTCAGLAHLISEYNAYHAEGDDVPIERPDNKLRVPFHNAEPLPPVNRFHPEPLSEAEKRRLEFMRGRRRTRRRSFQAELLSVYVDGKKWAQLDPQVDPHYAFSVPSDVAYVEVFGHDQHDQDGPLLLAVFAVPELPSTMGGEEVRLVRRHEGGQTIELAIQSVPEQTGDGTVYHLQIMYQRARRRTPVQARSRSSRDKNSDFEPIEPGQLKRVAALAQCLDDQWVPSAVLHTLLRKGMALDDVQKARRRPVREEYLRALINTEQLVINLRYMWDNPVVFRDAAHPGKRREALLTLLSAGDIVPYLFKESSPLAPPPGYLTIHPEGWDIWQCLCQEVRMQCVRLDWDEANNEKATQAVSRQFHNWVDGAFNGDLEAVAPYLGLPLEAIPKLRQRLLEMRHCCEEIFVQQGRFISRTDLYRKFILADEDREKAPAHDARYDGGKPFAREIKQLLDLRYNTNLSDALGRYALTPTGTLPRTALLELDLIRQERTALTADELEQSLRHAVFSLIQGECVKSLGALSLPDVLEIRRMDEWFRYIESLDMLLENPWKFADSHTGAGAVYSHYVQLYLAITKRLQGKQGSKTAVDPWNPVIELRVISHTGAELRLLQTLEGRFSESSGPPPSHANRNMPVTLQLIIGGTAERGSQADLRTSADLIRGYFQDPRDQWTKLVSKVAEFAPPFAARQLRAKQQPATVNHPDEEVA